MNSNNKHPNSFIFEDTRGLRHKFEQTYDDLDIDRVTDALDRTITVFGRRKLKSELKYVKSDSKDIDERVALLERIHASPEYVETMSETLLKIRNKQDTIVNWMKSHPDRKQCENAESGQGTEHMEGFNQKVEAETNMVNKDAALYYAEGKHNPYGVLNNRVMLSVSNRLIMSSILITICIYVFLYLYMNFTGVPVSAKEYAIRIYQGYVFFCGMLLSTFMSDIDWIENLAIVLAITYVGYQIYCMYQASKVCYEHYCLCADFMDRYAKVSDYLVDVETLVKNDSIVIENSESIIEAIVYLKSYFDKSSGLGYSLITQIKTYDYERHMNTIANYVGKIDMLCGLSVLLDSDNGYRLPTAIHSTKTPRCEFDFPYLNANNMWNPLLGYDKSVKNSLAMAPSLPNVLVLTGPNKAGKSTFMKTLMLCVYLAQSVGVTCCRLTFTPFRDLFTYLNIPDSIGRESLFEAEVNRCYEYLKSSEALRGFSIGIIDELFTGTNPAEGMAGSYAVLKQMTQNPVNITIISTHFHDMIEKLATNEFMFGKFNCRIGYKNGRTLHDFDYVLRPGVSDQKIGLSLLQEKGFECMTVRNAERFIKMINRTKSPKSHQSDESDNSDESEASHRPTNRSGRPQIIAHEEESAIDDDKQQIELVKQLEDAIRFSEAYDKSKSPILTHR